MVLYYFVTGKILKLSTHVQCTLRYPSPPVTHPIILELELPLRSSSVPTSAFPFLPANQPPKSPTSLRSPYLFSYHSISSFLSLSSFPWSEPTLRHHRQLSLTLVRQRGSVGAISGWSQSVEFSLIVVVVGRQIREGWTDWVRFPRDGRLGAWSSLLMGD